MSGGIKRGIYFCAALLKPTPPCIPQFKTMNQALQTLLEDVHPLARACVKFVPPECPSPCAARNCCGTGEIDLMDFEARLDQWDHLFNCALGYTTNGKRCNAECWTYLRTGLCGACQRKAKALMDKPRVDCLGRASQVCDQPRSGFLSVAPQEIPIVIPQNAYRNLIDYLRFDWSFCNHAIPTFLPMGWVSLNFHLAPREKSIGPPMDKEEIPYVSMCCVKPYVTTTSATTHASRASACLDLPMTENAGGARADASELSTQEGQRTWRVCRDELDLLMARAGSLGSWRRGWDEDLWYLGPRELRLQKQKARNRANKVLRRKW